MTTNFYTADTHFNHPFVAGTRGFTTAEEHDENLIDNFNFRLHKNDHLWILGDLFMGSVTEGLKQVSRLKGIKHLVLGNHDAAHPMHKKSHTHMRRFLEVFESVHLHEQHRIAGQKVNLSHFPYSGDHKPDDRHTQWRLQDEELPILHGHVHQEFVIRHTPKGTKQINVGVDSYRYPISVDAITDLIGEN
jgi:calcineurin-like phosphoesterase family protein